MATPRTEIIAMNPPRSRPNKKYIAPMIFPHDQMPMLFSSIARPSEG
jgi:hypothetical protein